MLILQSSQKSSLFSMSHHILGANYRKIPNSSMQFQYYRRKITWADYLLKSSSYLIHIFIMKRHPFIKEHVATNENQQLAWKPGKAVQNLMNPFKCLTGNISVTSWSWVTFKGITGKVTSIIWAWTPSSCITITQATAGVERRIRTITQLKQNTKWWY